MIKENVLRRNLITNEIDMGDVDLIFEVMNLAGNIVAEAPWVEISENDTRWKALQFTKLKTNKIIEVNAEAGNRILAKYPQYKQNNMLGEISIIHNKEMVALKNGTSYGLSSSEKEAIRKHEICIDYINRIREKSNYLTHILNATISISEIQLIDISDDKYW